MPLKTGLQMDETALIRAAQEGDQDAFEQLVRAYDQSVLRLAMNLLRSPEDAHDIYQEAFLRVYRNLKTFRFDCSFHTWLYRIVTNLCLDHMRKRKVRKEEPTVLATAEGPLDRMDAVPEERVDGDPQRHLFSGQVRQADQGSAGRADAARADGVRAAALPGIAAAEDRRGIGDHRGSGQELPVPGDAEDASGFGRFRMNGYGDMSCAAAREQLALLLYGELSFDEEERVESHLDACAECRDRAGAGEGGACRLRRRWRSRPRHRCCGSAVRIFALRLMEEQAAPHPARGPSWSWWDRFFDGNHIATVRRADAAGWGSDTDRGWIPGGAHAAGDESAADIPLSVR